MRIISLPSMKQKVHHSTGFSTRWAVLRGIEETAGGAAGTNRIGASPMTDWWLVAFVVTAGTAASLQIGKAAIAIPLLQVGQLDLRRPRPVRRRSGRRPRHA